ncbi:nicotinate (nicotinamide) nucleotide adenylyltransferase [Reinekea thalattae]|uniref:Probable nicotinate-nucleotide adenylyltransferase n=1 Tax=Reinekea thalattae TaxID=2593301 RepID=A0A5C8ZA26_9GAMM|nr:nicotinate (nicotinamide) nucleotide adenylyltransferase [Reinekea thalattae]
MVKSVSLKSPIIAIYGGTFDPFHQAHAAVCHRVLSFSQVSQLRVVPCFIPALKQGATASAEHRVAMLEQWRIAQSEAARIQIDQQETQRQGASYTIDTVENIARQQPDAKLIFVLGADAWHSLPRWHRAAELMQKVSFWVFNRAGEAAPVAHQSTNHCLSVEQLFTQQVGHFCCDDSIDLPLSSTDYRESLDETDKLPHEVADYITKNQLYRKVQ